VVLAGATIIAIPLIIGMVRSARMLGFVLAVRALPMAGRRRADFAAAPRRALVTMLQLGTLLIVGAPIIAITQPFIPRFPGFSLLGLMVIILGIAFWRSALNLQEHAKAGAEVIVSALTPRLSTTDDEEDLYRTMEHVAIMLPGLGEPMPVRISETSPAVDRSLAELNVRGKTGATILAITRQGEAGARVIVPSGREIVRAGDIIALAGSQEAVDAAAEMLAVSRRRARVVVNPEEEELGHS
jgi:CPA2 family monovalent cation:H+ antiporter-2